MSIYPDSTECLKSELDIFTIPHTQISFEDSRYEEVFPVTSVERQTPLEFRCLSDVDYTDLSSVFLYIKTKIVQRDGLADIPAANNMADIEKVYPINNFHASMFKNIEVYLNNTLVSSNDNLYGYRAFIEKLGTFHPETLQQNGACSMYFNDSGNLNDIARFPVAAAHADKNLGATQRFERSKNSRSFEMYGKLHADIFNCNRHLLNGVELKLRLIRQDPKFCLMATDAAQNYEIVIEKAVMYVKQDKVLPSVRESHDQEIMQKTAKYPIRKVNMKYFTKSAGLTDISELEICKGVLPRRIIFGFVNATAFAGDLHLNPLNFQHFNVRNITMRINGVAKPWDKLEFDFTNKNFLHGYLSLQQATEKLFTDNPLAIKPFGKEASFENGHSLFGFNLAQNCGECLSLQTHGKIAVEIKLAQALDHPIVLIVFLEYDDILEVNSFKNVVEN